MLSLKNYSIRISSLATIVFVLVMTFYPLVAVIPWFLSVPSNPISVSYRFIYLLLSIVVLLYGVVNVRKLCFSYGMYAFVLFWIGYLVRLVYDLSIRDVKTYGSDFYLYTFAIGGCFLPALALSIAMPVVNKLKLIRVYWFFLLLMNVVVFTQLLVIYGVSSEIFTERLRVDVDGANVVNPIPLSRGGGMLAVMSIFFLLFPRFKIVFSQRLVMTLALALGGVNLLLGASRGPIASFGLVVIVMLFVHAGVVRKNLAYLLKLGGAVMAFGLVTVLYLVPLITAGNLSIVKRTTDALNNGFGQEVRAYQWRAAIAQIKESPVWGERIVETYANFYPHNIFIEIVMATGIVGGGVFCAVCFNLFSKFLSAIRYKDVSMVLFFLLGLQFMFGLSGLAIPTAWYFWMLIAVCLSMNLGSGSLVNGLSVNK